MSKIFVCGDFRAKDCSKVHVSKELNKIIVGADLSICNFEAPVKSDGDKIPKSGPSLYQDENAPQFLKEIGFNGFLLANNHIMDYGKEGCQKTLDAFAGSICVGAGTGTEAYKVKCVVIDGKTIGLLSLVQHEFGCVETNGGDEDYGTAWINSMDIRDIVIKAKESVDFLLVFPHAGVENIDAPLPEWRLVYKRLIDWGADAIIASHPHVPQGWEVYKNKRIFYSLGNFYFDELSGGDYWNKSIAVEINITDSLEFKTYNLVFDKNGQVAIDDSVKTHSHIDHINYLLSDETLYSDYINEMCNKKFEGVKYHLLRGVGGVALGVNNKYLIKLIALMFIKRKNEMDLLNLFQNESHRWLIERYLRINNGIL